MIFYDVKVGYEYNIHAEELGEEDCGDDPSAALENFDEDLPSFLNHINENLGIKCGYGNKLSIFAYDVQLGEMSFLVAINALELSPTTILNVIENYLRDKFNAFGVHYMDITEITSQNFLTMLDRADDDNYLPFRNFSRFTKRLKLDCFDNNFFKLKEYVCSSRYLSRTFALKKANEFLLGENFTTEVKRIYSSANRKEFCGIPVHYEITASNAYLARRMVELLVRALYSNKRLLSTRVSKVFNVSEGCFDELDLENVFINAKGSTIVLEMQLAGESAPADYKKESQYISKLIQRYCNSTLIVFVELKEQNSFAAEAQRNLEKVADIIKLGEGCGDRNKAIAYFKQLLYEADETLPMPKPIGKLFPSNYVYSPSAVYSIFAKWQRNALKETVYKAYKDLDVEVAKEKILPKAGSAYEKLQKMVGLTEVKSLLDQIIANFLMQKRRSELGISTEKHSMHMIFTGNPGTAKTTVARLLAEILCAKGILQTGNFVECGRSDLVGKYVGWTAKAVREKFNAAKGGVLFIDEAYSLVDDYNSFGDEAINTIVQEMENNREDTMVIFAGYPEKMASFLHKNEGLRSRIAFHIKFPDYKVEELLAIFKLMATEQQYILSPEVLAQSREIFATACTQPDFGNGRFVRNLFEQVQMQQALRLAHQFTAAAISKEALLTLQTEDFSAIVGKFVKKPAKQEVEIGFRA